MKKRSKVEILRGKLRRLGVSDEVHTGMPEDVAGSFIAELRFCPDTGAIAARNWRPDHRNEQPWIREMLDAQRRLRARAKGVVPSSEGVGLARDEPVN
jgi:hypothetical protein